MRHGCRVSLPHALRSTAKCQTCKANGVDPQPYIADVIGKIAADWPAARWDELMPWNRAQQPAKPVAQAA
ncbi:transposase domain-containing protein [Sphingomonas sp. PP-CC-3A-396]|uniref:transposase domain-containing protein n=1 Tax=Sphingomonas sp. PP-CC-3A-396 TaxID=2135655 RepID=UPI0032605F3E